MAVIAVLLFAVIGVMPVAADNPWNEGGIFHYTNISPTNQPIRFDSFNDGKYWFSMPNGTGGMNAVHIANSPVNVLSSLYGQCNEKIVSNDGTSGTFYVTDTGGRGYQDNIILLIGVYSDQSVDRDNFQIDINASGYQWTPTDIMNSAPPEGAPQPAYTKVSLDASNYLNDTSGVDISQEWKFAPLQDYPTYCGQNMAEDEEFNLMVVDLKLGIVANSSYNYNLNNNGTVKVDYNIVNPEFPDGNMKIAFNVYAYNHYTSQGWDQTLWLNRVNDNTQTPVPGTNSYSGWLVYNP